MTFMHFEFDKSSNIQVHFPAKNVLGVDHSFAKYFAFDCNHLYSLSDFIHNMVICC